MSRKREVLIKEFDQQGKHWRLTVESNDQGLKDALVSFIKEKTAELKLKLKNLTDPFQI